MYFTAEEKVQIYYEDVGSGAPVVMIHGAATSSKVYDGLASRMVAQFRCIRLDLRGLGRSDRVDAVSPTAWCDDTMALMDHLGIDKAHLLGCSLGARIAGRLVLDHPGRFETLTVDAPLVAVATAASSRLNTRFSNLDNPDPTDRRRWQNFHGADWREAVSFYFRARNDPALQEHLTLRPHLSSITLPTLITRGDIDDDVHPLSHTIEWHAARPSSWLWIAPGTAFSAAQNQAAAFARVFGAFVERSAADKAT
ncbi:MAG TPA: alpha/beta hydrolase [Gemmatimonadales bacterium]|nr:alpha/beta hydrolase [Gemmatimonadales bacterium]